MQWKSNIVPDVSVEIGLRFDRLTNAATSRSGLQLSDSPKTLRAVGQTAREQSCCHCPTVWFWQTRSDSFELILQPTVTADQSLTATISTIPEHDNPVSASGEVWFTTKLPSGVTVHPLPAPSATVGLSAATSTSEIMMEL